MNILCNASCDMVAQYVGYWTVDLLLTHTMPSHISLTAVGKSFTQQIWSTHTCLYSPSHIN